MRLNGWKRERAVGFCHTVLWGVAAVIGCSSPASSPDAGIVDGPEGVDAAPRTALEMTMTRMPGNGVDPFVVTVTVLVDGVPTAGKTVSATVPRGATTAVTDAGGGSYQFTVTPSATGVHPVSVAVDGVTLTRKAIVLDTYGTGVGQPMAVPGDFVNTPGYEDGITITPDGQYLFVQYGPLYFSSIPGVRTICADAAYEIGYNLNDCAGRPNSGLVFDPIGPFGAPERPGFHAGAIVGGRLRHLPGFVISGVANGLLAPPTMLYGFKRQSDGTFAEPFHVAFDDPKGINGPFGLSFVLDGAGRATFAVAWNNFLNNLGDDDADIYTGTLTLGEDTSLGTVTYGPAFGGDSSGSIVPTIQPVGFPSHAGQQGNPHLAANSSGEITSIWVDDEITAHDVAVYRLTAGTFPSGTWLREEPPPIISTAEEEDQPFFTGTELILSRGANIVAHAYTPTAGACAGGFSNAACWGAEQVLLGGNGHTGVGELFGVGEPTIATIGSKRYLYFVYVEVRDPQRFPGIVDYNLDAGFVEIP